jgi:short-subunit dehydrogenase
MAVYPGPIATDFDASTRLFGNFSLPRNRRARSAAEVARRIVEAERAGKTRLTLSHLPTLVGGVQRLAPRVARQAFRLLGARRR